MRRTRRQFLAHSAAAATLAAAAPRTFLAAEPTPAQLAQDPLRPQFHLLPPGNWMNDPNGPIVLSGTSHVFYQLNPHGPAWGDIHWGHSTSTDLVHWQHQPVALFPTPGSSDQDGCWSGSALEHNGEVLAFYTGVVRVPRDKATCKGDISYRETQNLATAPASNPRLLKKQGLPVLSTPPAGLDVTGFRDPAPFRLAHDSKYTYMAVGSGIVGKHGAILLYRSPDLQHWEYLHNLFEAPGNGKATSDPVDAGTMFECPDVFEVDGHHVLLYSTERKVFWVTGNIDEKSLVFHQKQRGLLDTGAFYAPKSMLHPTFGRVLWGWVPETRPEADYVHAGWAGLMALPRILHVTPEGQLTQSLPPTLASITGTPQNVIKPVTLPSLAAHISATLIADSGFILYANDETLATLQVSPEGRDLLFNGTHLAHEVGTPLHLWVDGSVLELFRSTAPDGTAARTVHTQRSYPQLAPGATLRIVPVGPEPPQLTIAPVTPTSPNRLTT